MAACRPGGRACVAHFGRYTELANGVLRTLNLDMPAIELDGLRNVAMPQRRPVVPASPTRPNPGSQS